MTREELLACLEDRPCNVCEFHTEEGCNKWSCVFEEEPDEPSGDLISREKAKQLLYERLDRLNDDELYDIFSRIIDDMYNELPSITPTQSWIPVSERLPKLADVYRVTRYYPNNVMNPVYLVDACCFDGCNTWYDDNRINHERAYVDNVIAWQENPEPYKTERSGEE